MTRTDSMSLSPPSAPPKTFERALFAEDEENGIAESTEERRRVLNSSWETFRIRPRSGITSLATRADGEVLTTLHDDAPFLLDSILAYLNERGCVLKTIRHPILAVRRDSRGRAIDVSNRRERSEGFRLESFIRIGISGATPAPEGLSLEISRIVADAAAAAAGWKDMRERVALAAETLRDRGDSEEAAFLEWLLADRFIFLGVADYALRKGRLRLKPASGLGLLKDGRLKVLRRGARAVNDTPELRQFLSAPGSPLLATKANFRTRVHRRAHMDYISVKTFPTSGEKAVGELRIVGLLSAATRRLNPHAIPLVGDRLRRVENASSHAPDSHSGKSLRRALETCPLDEMFQMTDDDLRRYARRMASLHLRPRVGVSARRDRFDRYVSAIVAVPREKYDTQARLKIGELLAEAYAGRISFSRQIPTDGPLAHAHFIVAREREMKRDPSLAELSRRLAARLRAWEDDMIDALRLRGEDAEALRAEARDGNAFPPGYKARFTGDQAVEDLIRFRRDIPREGDEAARFAFRDGDDEDAARFIALRRGGASALSARLPILENMGLEAIYEDSFIIRLGAGDQNASAPPLATLHETLVRASDGRSLRRDPDLRRRLEEGFLAASRGFCDDDPYNALILRAALTWREAAALRTLGGWLKQISSTFSAGAMTRALNARPEAAKTLAEAFRTRFEPFVSRGDDSPSRRLRRKRAEARIRKRFARVLADVDTLNEDTILRRFMAAIEAATRTNFFQKTRDEEFSTPIAIKFAIKNDESEDVLPIPSPRPFAEIYARSPRLEGVHLRAGAIARGGIRWSDRREDFREEVRQLADAQHLKNSLIVPDGAKGGFVISRPPDDPSPEGVRRDGRQRYAEFIDAMLSVTDNRDGDRIVAPPRLARRDGDDAYLVVAADKGTARFSDLANERADAQGFWLGDAFASGGRVGYDHKKMGITARGAWIAVAQHFHEIGRDVRTQTFSAVGVGDMSGDVFGNGMLMSNQTRLLAAFDHRHVLLDPDPDPSESYLERKRLFRLAASSWEDYDPKKISSGGGVFSRSAKSIPISTPARRALAIEANALSPDRLVAAILKAPVDLIWFGGIGSYVRADSERNPDVGDPQNDDVRIAASEMTARIVGEGANLAMTRAARTQFAELGGRLNADFIDNSAGVNASDVEVNVKIALDAAVRAQRMTRKARNRLLLSMTDEAGRIVLRNNVRQTRSISLARAYDPDDAEALLDLMRDLETKGRIHRLRDGLPDDAEIARRRARRAASKRGAAAILTRPEIAALSSYEKIALAENLLNGDAVNHQAANALVVEAFPSAMRRVCAREINEHPLRRRIVATRIASDIASIGGPGFAARIRAESGCDTDRLATAWLAAAEDLNLPDLAKRLDGLAADVPWREVLSLMRRTSAAMRQAALERLRRSADDDDATSDAVADAPRLVAALPAPRRARLRDDVERLRAAGISASSARRFAALPLLADAVAARDVAARRGVPLLAVAKILFALDEALDVERAASLVPETEGPLERVAVARARHALRAARFAAAEEILALGIVAPPLPVRLKARIENQFAQAVADASPLGLWMAARAAEDLAQRIRDDAERLNAKTDARRSQPSTRRNDRREPKPRRRASNRRAE